MASCMEVFKSFWSLRPLLFPLAIILGALPILFLIDENTMPESATRCLYIVVVMAFLWVTEALPVTVTALLPVVMFPMAEVMPAKQVSGYYINDTSMLFFGGLLVAVAVETWNLHKRIAVLILKGVGSEPKWLLLGLMLPTWFLSMWISNTATASMMIPIANAIIHQTNMVRKNQSSYLARDRSTPLAVTLSTITDTDKQIKKTGTEKNVTTTEIQDGGTTSDPSDHSREMPTEAEDGDGQSRRTTIAFTLCIAYSANIGGIATLTGTPPNLVFRGVADDFYRSYQIAANSNDTSGAGVTFASWMSMALPLSFLTMILAWLVLVIVFMTGRGCCTSNPEQNAAVKKIVDKEWKGLGNMCLAEIETLIIFVCLVVLWISRDPKESPGWSTLFKTGYVSDSVSSMTMGILLFILPAKLPSFGQVQSKDDSTYTPILTWQQVHEKVPWGVLLLLGGGFALANGCKESGLSQWLGEQFATLDYLDTWVFNMVICMIVAAFTEVTSNTATTTLIMPILADLAVAIRINPLYLMMTATIGASFAFMLPVATPPNAIVFSYGQVRIVDMASVGLIMNIIAVGMVTLCVNTWGGEIFDFDNFDSIFNATLPVKGAN